MMSQDWQRSWSRATDYWQHHWKRWMAVLAAAALWIWIVLLAVPQLTPFIFMEIQPINDKSVARSDHQQFTQLVSHWHILALALVVTGILGGIVVGRLVAGLRELAPQRGMGWGIWGSAAALVLASAAMGSVRIPLGSSNPGMAAVRGLALLVVFIVIVPWTFWQGSLRAGGGPGFWSQLRTRPRDTLFLPWTWLVTMVCIQMLSDSIAWTTTVSVLGTLVWSVLAVASGLLHQSVAFSYRRNPVNSGQELRRTS